MLARRMGLSETGFCLRGLQPHPVGEAREQEFSEKGREQVVEVFLDYGV